MTAQPSEADINPGVQWLTHEMRGDAFWRQLPAEIRAGLTGAQEQAIRATAGGAQSRHPIDYRLTLRLPLIGDIYLVLLGGRERRNELRRSLDQALRPQSFLQHLVFAILGLIAVSLVAAIGILLYAALR
ncbi:MAG TPA: hypothetical protein VM659_26665 [Dongiaceae bacterium]|nr:hypothetical protein [Dongiaceae bacterium]